MAARDLQERLEDHHETQHLTSATPRSGRRNDLVLSHGSRPENTGFQLRSSFSGNEARSLDSGWHPPSGYGATLSYQNIEVDNPTCGEKRQIRNKFVFCIHGNKFGYANCCDDFDAESARSVPVDYRFEENGESRPLLSQERDLTIIAHGREPVPNDSDRGSHCHTSTSVHSIDKKARRALIIASVLCLIFMVIEATGGILANSLAIATDAAHLLSDFASFMISLFALYLGSRPATQGMSFGWHRAEIIGATVSVLMIWVVTGILVYMAIQRLIYREFDIDSKIMLITSGIAVTFNIIMGFTLHPAGSSHGHSHGGGADGNINVRAAFLHVVGDLIQAIGVFLTALLIYFFPNLTLLDPILTFVFCLLVLFTTIRLLRETVNILMEGTPAGYSIRVVEQTFLEVDGIKAVHNIRMWCLTTGRNALSAHLAVCSHANPHTITREAAGRIREKYNFFDMTLQVEEFNEDMEDCNQCQNPVS